MEIADPTLEALVDASNFPLSIVMIGVGDGPWGLMEDCDDLLPSRKFDNFQVIFNTELYVKCSECTLHPHITDSLNITPTN